MSIICFGATDIGKKRKTNQDSICLEHDFSFFAVADGMGGHNGGDIASQLAVKIMKTFISGRDQSHEEQTYTSNEESTKEKFLQNDLSKNDSKVHEKLMSEMIKEINHSIFQEAQKDKNLEGMGTTISAISFAGPELIIGNVGDSRVYLVNQKRIYQLTRDHSFVQEKISSGFYTREEALRDPQRNILTKSVGFEREVSPDIFHYKIRKNDIFLICSDGLHGKTTDQEILAIINEFIPDPSICTSSEVETAVKNLIHYANEQGGHDNISVILSVAQGN